MAPGPDTDDLTWLPLRRLLRDSLETEFDGWLLLPSDEEWSLDTLGAMDDRESVGEDDDDEVVIGDQRYAAIIDGTTLEGIGWSAAQLQAPPSDDTLFEAFRYYVRFDAFLPRIGAPDPPPTHEIILRLDREFWERLGPEDAGKPCRHDGCDRGSVRFSVLCRAHHFESIKNKPCPFVDGP